MVQRIVDSIGPPATVSNMRGDCLTANPLGRALYAPLFDSREQPPNSARFTFLDPAAQQFFTDWEKSSQGPGRRPSLGGGPKSTRPRAYRPRRRAVDTQRAIPKWWAAHNVRYHQTGRKRLHHPTVGDLELDYEVMELSADRGLRLAVFSAEPGSRSAEGLDLLASWTATPDATDRSPQRG